MAAEAEMDPLAVLNGELNEMELIAHLRAVSSPQHGPERTACQTYRCASRSRQIVEVRLMFVTVHHEPGPSQLVQKSDQPIPIVHLAGVLGVQVFGRERVVMAHEYVHRLEPTLQNALEALQRLCR